MKKKHENLKKTGQTSHPRGPAPTKSLHSRAKDPAELTSKIQEDGQT